MNWKRERSGEEAKVMKDWYIINEKELFKKGNKTKTRAK